MKDEIKEKMTIGKAKKILRGFLAKDCYYDTPLYYAIPYLLDYITNLEKERNMFKGAFETMTENYFEENKRLRKDYGRLMQDNAYTLELEQELDKYKNIIDELEKDIKKEIKRTEELILEDGGLIEITNIRKMLNDERKNMLFKLDKLKELKGSDSNE